VVSTAKHFLIVYDKTRHKLMRCTEYTSEQSGQLALADRFTLERVFQRMPWMEVVVLGADSLDTIKRTHSRYFTGSTATCENRQGMP
jgi:hypothetical protein